jgi:hypothetical protein
VSSSIKDFELTGRWRFASAGRRFFFGIGRCYPYLALVVISSGSRTPPLFGNVHFVKSKSLCNCVANRSFAPQNHVQVSPINAEVLRKCDLTSLAFNCDSQQVNEVIVVKYKNFPAPTAGEGKGTFHRTKGVASSPAAMSIYRMETRGRRTQQDPVER